MISNQLQKNRLLTRAFKDKNDSADNIYLKIAPAAPPHSPAFRQLSLGGGYPVIDPVLTEGEEPSWHRAALGQWQSQVVTQDSAQGC